MSPFMSSMPDAGLIEMPPVSKQTPLPMNATGGVPFLPPFQRMTTMRLGCSEPCPTPSSAFIPNFFMAGTSRISTATPNFLRPLVRRANSSGNSTLGGSLTRSRASNTPLAIASRDANAFCTAATLDTAMPTFTCDGGWSSSLRLVL